MILSKEPIRVSDHAVLRYMQRQMGLNVELVRQHIFALCATPAAFGAACVRAEGVKFIINDLTVVTVAPDTDGPTALRQRQLVENAGRCA